MNNYQGPRINEETMRYKSHTLDLFDGVSFDHYCLIDGITQISISHLDLLSQDAKEEREKLKDIASGYVDWAYVC